MRVFSSGHRPSLIAILLSGSWRWTDMGRTLAGLLVIVGVVTAGIWAVASMVTPPTPAEREPALVVPAAAPSSAPGATPSLGPDATPSPTPSVTPTPTAPSPTSPTTTTSPATSDAPQTVRPPKPSYYDDDDDDDHDDDRDDDSDDD